MKPYFLLIPLIFASFFFISPERAFADCDISLSASADAALYYVPRDPSAEPGDVSITVKWKANQDCFGPVGLVINQGNIFENEPLSGSKTITVKQRNFDKQTEAECLAESDPQVLSLARILTPTNAYNLGCTTNKEAERQWPGLGPDSKPVTGLVVKGLRRSDADLKNRIASDITFAVKTGGSASRTGSVRVCSLFEGRDPSLCKDAQGHGAGYLEIAPMARKFGPIGPWEAVMDPAYPANSDIKASSIEIILDPDYVKKTLEERKFTPTINNLNPLDTIRVRAVIRSQRTDVHKYLRVKLLTTDKEGKEIDLTPAPTSGIGMGGLGLYVLWRNEEALRNPTDPKIKTEVDQWFLSKPAEYTFESDPLNLGAYADKITESLVAGRKIFLRFYRPNLASAVAGDTNIVKVDKELKLGTCVQMYGEGKHKMVGMWGESQTPHAKVHFTEALRRGSDIFQKGLEGIEPYRSRKDTFSYYIDLIPFDDSYILKDVARGSTAGQFFATIQLPGLERKSACKNGTLYSMSAHMPPSGGLAGLSDLSGHFVYGPLQTSAGQSSVDAFNHEAGHALGKLYDTNIKVKRFPFFFFTNCTTNKKLKSAFMYQDIFYAHSPEMGGCTAEKTLFASSQIFSSSKKSLMSYEIDNSKKYDTVECGWVLSRLEGGGGQSHFPECARLLGQIFGPFDKTFDPITGEIEE